MNQPDYLPTFQQDGCAVLCIVRGKIMRGRIFDSEYDAEIAADLLRMAVLESAIACTKDMRDRHVVNSNSN